MVNNNIVTISAIFRFHDMHKSEFIVNLKKLWISLRKIQNHLIAGDFNTEIWPMNIFGIIHRYTEFSIKENSLQKSIR